MWDVAGVIEPVPDPNLARTVMGKVNDINNDAPLYTLIVAMIWSVLPQDTALLLAWAGVFLSSLYLIRDKVPKDV